MHVIFWAERVLITAAHAAACPHGLDPVLAGALQVNGLTALQALEMLGLGRGQRLLVTNGGGAIGSLAIQLAAAMGVEVTTTTSASAAGRLAKVGIITQDMRKIIDSAKLAFVPTV